FSSLVPPPPNTPPLPLHDALPISAGNATLQAIEYLHRNRMYVVGGLIVGNPDDTPESIEANLDFARRYVDYPYIQHPTPYPRTRSEEHTSELQSRGHLVCRLLLEK